MSERRALIVSPYFPPSTLAGVHRARHLAKHLSTHGWTPAVLRVSPECYTERNDPGLAALVPPDVRQVAVKAIPAPMMRRLGIGDIGIRAYPNLRSTIRRIVRSGEVHVVLITGAPFYPLCLSRTVASNGRHVPVILDFQDPWVSELPSAAPLFSKAGLTSLLAQWLEPVALRGAAAVTSVSAVQNQELAARYPWLDVPMEAIPIGGDPDDFEALRRIPLGAPAVMLEPDLIHLSYVGTFLPRAGALVAAVFRAFRAWATAHPGLAERVRLNFVGTSNQPDDTTTFRVMPIARECGIERYVREVPQRVPFLDALMLLARSQGLLLIGSDEPHYTASKIYPALMSGTPYLSLFHKASSADAILRSAGGGRCVSFGTVDALVAAESAIADGLAWLGTGAPAATKADPAAYADFTADAVAGRYARLFDRLVGPP